MLYHYFSEPVARAMHIILTVALCMAIAAWAILVIATICYCFINWGAVFVLLPSLLFVSVVLAVMFPVYQFLTAKLDDEEPR